MKKISKKQPAPKSRVFEVVLPITVRIRVDQEVIDSVDDSWREQFYRSIQTPEDIAGHLAFNMAYRSAPFPIDGFAQLKPDQARIVWEECGDPEVVEIDQTFPPQKL